MPQQPAKATGFTLLELLITTLLGAMLLLGGTAMFGLFLRNSSATNVRKQINQEGKHIMGWLEYNLRNAQNVNCPASNVITFKNQRGQDWRVQQSGDLIEVDPPATGTTFYRLHTAFSVVATGATFACDTATNARLVTINFTLRDATSTITQQFRTDVQVRNAALR